MIRKKFSVRFHRNTAALITYVFISMLLLVFSTGGFVLDTNVGFTALSTMQKGVKNVTDFFTNSVDSMRELSHLKDDYESLLEEMKNYEILQQANADIRKENETLKELLGFTKTRIEKTIPAEIIARDPNAMYSGIIIDKGIKDGLRKDMPVIAYQNGKTGLVGKVVKVGHTTSMIIPVYDYQCYVSARLEKNRYEGLVNGNGIESEYLTMRYIKKRIMEELSYGDVIVTSGENMHYPKNVPIGTIVRIQALDYATSIELTIEPIIEFSSLEYVFVLDMKEIALVE